MNTKVSYGSDPELMIFNNAKDKIVSSLNIFNRIDKYNPINLGWNRNVPR